MAGLGPLILGVIGDGGVERLHVAAGSNDFAVLDDAAHNNLGCTVRRGSGKLHEDGRVVGTLEVGEVPTRGSVVGLHDLDGVRVQRAALEVDGAIGRGDGALNGASRPECMSHNAPRVLQIGAELCRARLAGLKSRCGLCDLDVDDGPLVVHALDGV